MAGNPLSRAARWSGWAALALLAATFGLGVAVSSATRAEVALEVVVLAVVLCLAWLWSFTLRRTASREARQRWACVVLSVVLFVAAIGAGIWWWRSRGAEVIGGEQPAAATNAQSP